MAKEKSKNIIVPGRVDSDSQLEKALKRKDVREALANYQGDPESFKAGLRYHIEKSNYGFERLRKFASTIDGVNRATVPIDGALDYFNVALGVGYAAKGIKTLALAPGYLAYDAYYTAKTGDVLRGMILNPAYEVLSWASLGALPHILRHYTKQVDKKATEEGSKKFLDNLSKKNESLEDKIIEVPFGEDKKSKERRLAA